MSLILDHLFYSYGAGSAFETQALIDVSLTVDDGEFVAIIGHTGSGKSTLIQTMNGLIRPVSGSVYFEGADIFDEGYDLRALRTRVGLVFQYPEYQLFETTVFKDVCFGPKNQGLSEKECALRAYEALKNVGLSDELFESSPFELSGGQKRRVALAGVIAMRPKILVLDEPTAGLDPVGRKELYNLLYNLRKKYSMSIVLVSHSMDDVAVYADKIVVMDKGRIVLGGDPSTVFENEEFLKECGLALPQTTSLLRRLKAAGLDLPATAVTVEEAKNEIINALYARR